MCEGTDRPDSPSLPCIDVGSRVSLARNFVNIMQLLLAVLISSGQTGAREIRIAATSLTSWHLARSVSCLLHCGTVTRCAAILFLLSETQSATACLLNNARNILYLLVDSYSGNDSTIGERGFFHEPILIDFNTVQYSRI